MKENTMHLIGEGSIKGIRYVNEDTGIEVTLINKKARGNIAILMNEVQKIVEHFAKKRG